MVSLLFTIMRKEVKGAISKNLLTNKDLVGGISLFTVSKFQLIQLIKFLIVK